MKTKYGHMKCPDCAHRVVVKANEHGTLSYTCDECDSSAYARKDTGVYGAWDKRIEKAAAPPPAGKAPGAGDGKPKSTLDSIL